MKKILKCHDCQYSAEIDVDYSGLVENDWLECVEEGNGIFRCNDGKFRCEECENRHELGLIDNAKLRELMRKIHDSLLSLKKKFPTEKTIDIQITDELCGVSFSSRKANVVLVSRELENEDLDVVIAREYFYLLLPPELVSEVNEKITRLFSGSQELSGKYSQMFWEALATHAAHKFCKRPLLSEDSISYGNSRDNAFFMAMLIDSLLLDNPPDGKGSGRVKEILEISPDIFAMALSASELLEERLADS